MLSIIKIEIRVPKSWPLGSISPVYTWHSGMYLNKYILAWLLPGVSHLLSETSLSPSDGGLPEGTDYVMLLLELLGASTYVTLSRSTMAVWIRELDGVKECGKQNNCICWHFVVIFKIPYEKSRELFYFCLMTNEWLCVVTAYLVKEKYALASDLRHSSGQSKALAYQDLNFMSFDLSGEQPVLCESQCRKWN